MHGIKNNKKIYKRLCYIIVKHKNKIKNFTSQYAFDFQILFLVSIPNLEFWSPKVVKPEIHVHYIKNDDI